MANNLKSMIKVIANSDAIARLNECLDKCETGDITSFANAFYDNVEVSENGGVMNSWSLDNLGSKWNYLTIIPHTASTLKKNGMTVISMNFLKMGI